MNNFSPVLKQHKFNFRARFHYERRMEHFLFVLLSFLLLSALETAKSAKRRKKLPKERKNTLFHARRGMEYFFFLRLKSKRAPSKAKKTKNALFDGCSGNEP